MKNVLVALAVALLAAWPVAAAESYDMIVARLKAGDTKVDYTALRNGYAASPRYEPYGAGFDDDRKAMIDAFNKMDCKAALAKAGKVLEAIYVDIATHLVAGRCLERTGDAAKAEIHRAVARGLMSSILASGDGKTPKTAYSVVTVNEEYDVLRASRLNLRQQTLHQADGHTYDALETTAESGTVVTLYFQIDRPMAWLSKSLQR